MENSQENQQQYITCSGVRRTSLTEDVANGIAADIASGVLQPGEQIPKETELMQSYSVGRGTIREAVKLLVSRNVLEIRRGKGTFVCEIPGVSPDPLGLEFIQDKVKMTLDLLDIRRVLEQYAASKAAIHATPEQISHMKEIIYNAENTDDDAENIAYDMEFHKYIAECSGNSVIVSILPIIRKNLEDFNSLEFARDWNLVNRGHRAIVEAIENHDQARTSYTVEKHLDYALEILKNMLNR